MKVFSPALRTLHGLGAPSQSVLSHYPTQEQGRTAASWGSTSPGRRAPLCCKPGLEQEVRLSRIIASCHQSNGPSEAALSLCQPRAESQTRQSRMLPESSQPTNKAGKDCWECISFAKRRGRKSSFDAISLGGNFPIMCDFCSCDPFHLKRVVMSRADNTEENEKLNA